jgi:phosphatidylinositol dimannoside acyltransferase
LLVRSRLAVTVQPPPVPSQPPLGRGGLLALDGALWRRAARLGASRAPAWFVRWSPPVIGAAIALAAPDLRARISGQLARVRGRVSTLRNTIEVVHTFANFASCLAEVLSTGSKNGSTPEVTVHSGPRARRLLSTTGGAILATAHTAGWESLGALVAHEHHKNVIIVMQPERNDGARTLQDALRQLPRGVQILHVGSDPLASLPLIRHLREGGVVAVQIDRVPAGMTGHAVRLFGRPSAIPEGPLRLAQLTGAPIVPVFSARTGHRRYAVHVHEPIDVLRSAERRTIDAAAQRLADALEEFVVAHPTQWFPFHE